MATLSRLDRRTSYRAEGVGIVPIDLWWSEDSKSWFFHGLAKHGPQSVRRNPAAMAWTAKGVTVTERRKL